MDKSRQEKLDELSQASPLEISKKLKEFELYDKRSSQKIIDEVYEEFENGEDISESILKPVFYSVIDSFLEGTSIGKKARKDGLTASRLIKECEGFDYEGKINMEKLNGHAEYRNAEDVLEEYGKENGRDINTKVIRDQYKMNKYKDDLFDKETNGEGKLMTDEYTGKKNIHRYENDPDKRRNETKDKHLANTDHIVTLDDINDDFKSNYALNNDDLKEIANINENFAVTNSGLNSEKSGTPNKKFIDEQESNKNKGDDYYPLDHETKKRMIEKDKEAQKAINSNANNNIGKNLIGKGNGGYEQSKEIYGQASKHAKEQAKNYAVGNVILFIIKPLYFEIKDMFINGIAEDSNSKIEGLKIRFNRVKEHVISNAANFIGDNLWEFIKGFISSLIEGIISLFVGMFKQVLKLIKEGFQIFISSFKVLFGKESQNKTAAEKGDAIVKIIGGGVLAIAGIGIEALLNKIGIGEPWSIILSGLLSGIASALFMFLLDKADLFSAKAEKRKNRIEEIFDKRIKDIENAANDFNVTAIETLKKQRIEFDTINSEIVKGLNDNNINNINNGLDKMAEFFDVNLPYNNLDEFVDYFESDEALNL